VSLGATSAHFGHNGGPAFTAADLARELRYALDPVAFAIDRLGFTPDPWQERVLRSTKRQVLLNCTRQAGKSTTTAVIAAHTAIYRPNSLILLVSKAQRQSAELFAKVSGFLSAMETPPELDSDNRLSCKLVNGSRIISLPGDGDTIRGFSAATLVIEDEAAFVTDSLYQAVRPMLAVSGGKLILMSTPHGKRGHFFNAWASGGAAWHRESITAYQVPRISAEYLADERREIGDWWFAQEYECQFVDEMDQLFSTASIQAAITADVQPLNLSI
jgi:hypothetical protein